MKKIKLKNIFNKTVDCYISNIADRGYYYLRKYNFDFVCCWWCGNYIVNEYDRADGRRIAVAQLHNHWN